MIDKKEKQEVGEESVIREKEEQGRGCWSDIVSCKLADWYMC